MSHEYFVIFLLKMKLLKIIKFIKIKNLLKKK